MPLVAFGARCVLTVWLVLCLCGTAKNDEERYYNIDIPQLTVDEALNMLAQQTDVQLLFPFDLVKTLDAESIAGRYTLMKALEILLQDTGLAGGLTGSGVITISRVAPPDNQEEVMLTQTENKSPSKRRGLLGVLAAVFAISAGAQETPDPDENVIEEIIVTASRREEALRDVPAAITAFDPNDFTSRGLNSLQDMMGFAPSVIVENAGAPGLTEVNIRGISSGFAIPTVGVYVDDIPIGSNTAFTSGAFFTLEAVQNGVERIELIRGPQGTLYGASAIGGVLKYVTREPSTTEFHGRVSLDFSDTNDGGSNQIYSASLSIPIVENRLAVIVSGFRDDRDGYIDEAVRPLTDVNDSEVSGAFVSAVFTPTADLKIKLQYLGQKSEFDNQGRVDFDPATGDFSFGPWIKNDAVDTPRTIDFDVFGLSLEYDLDWATLILVGNTQESKNASILDLTAPFAGTIDFLAGHPAGTTQAVSFDTRNMTERDSYELRLQSPNNENFEWLAGLYYTDEDSLNFQNLTSDPNPSGFDLLTLRRSPGYSETALFVNGTYYITPNFDLNAGFRYSDNEATVQDSGSGFIRDGSGFLTTEIGETFAITDEVDTYLFTARYRPTENISLYARIASGYRPGGKNPFRGGVTGEPLGSQFFKADSLWSYEIGAKGILLDGRFTYDVATFVLNWDDQQIIIVRDGVGAASNALSGVTSNGVEASLGWRPTDGLRISGTLAYIDATLDGDEPDLAAVAGESLIDVPEWSGSISAIYDFSFTNNVDGFVGASARFVGERPAAFSGAPVQFTVPDYEVVDFSAGVHAGRYQFNFYINNVLDEERAFQQVTVGGRSTAAVVPPRTFGVVLAMDF